VLLAGAGLLFKSFVRVTRVDPGFAPDHVMTAQMTLPSARYGDAAARRAFWTALVERASAMPGVTAAGVVSSLPFGGRPSAGSYHITGRPVPPGGTPLHAQQDRVTGSYFRAMGIPLVEGRVFTDQDAADGPRVVIIDRFLAEHRFAGESPVGRQLNFGSARNYTIVGVVGTVNASDLSKPVPEERVYLDADQLPLSAMTLVVKTAADVSTAAPAVRSIVRALDPEQPIARMRPMGEWVTRSLDTRRAPMTLVVLFGAVALVLSAVGIYGVLAFGVAQRAREFGIRQALGADRWSILAMVLLHGLRAASAGIAMGVAGALLLGQSLRSMLFGVTPHDPAVFVMVTALLFIVALAACYVPARRATRVDPMAALRDS
jgi:putative ABC transport system permease protein